MDGNENKSRSERRRDSISVGGPYARIRAIAAVIVFLIVIVVMAVRALTG